MWGGIRRDTTSNKRTNKGRRKAHHDKRRVNEQSGYYNLRTRTRKRHSQTQQFEESIGRTVNRRAFLNNNCRVGPVWTELSLNEAAYAIQPHVGIKVSIT
eukprot:14474381-Heterocapsa_arctica.AAC.1